MKYVNKVANVQKAKAFYVGDEKADIEEGKDQEG
jgi:hypothetical protein